MAILNNLIVNGSSRFLNKAYFSDVSISGDTSLGTLSASSLTVSGTSTLTGAVSSGAITSTGRVLGKGFGIDNGMTVYPSNSNELNFGGTSGLGTGGSIYFGYRAVDSKPIPSKFVFGGSSGSANLTAGSVTLSGTIQASSGVLTSATIGTINATNASIKGTLRSETWDIQHVTQLFNDFAVSPSFKLSSAATIVVAKSGTTVTLTIKDTSSITSNTIGGAIWENGSQVKISGTLNGVVLGTCSGVTTARMNTTANTLNLSFTNVASTDPLGTVAAGTYTVAAGTVNEFYCMLLTVGNYPVGIRLTSYGTNKNSQIDIYGGNAGSYSSAYWYPSVRLGLLSGMKDASGNVIKVNGVEPSGWGLYTNNGYFSGIIVSESGKIGGFTLGSNAIYSASNSLGTVANNVYIGTEGISLGTTFKVTKAGALTATSGEIGGWTITHYHDDYDDYKALYYSSLTSSLPFIPQEGVLLLSPTGVKGYGSDDGALKAHNVWSITVDNKFGVTKSGILHAQGAIISGAITATSGVIGGWRIGTDTNKSLHNGSTDASPTPSANTIILSKGVTTSSAIGNLPAATYTITAGTNFGVTTSGALYASSGKIGKYDITSTYLSTGSGTTMTGIGGNQAFWAGSSDSNNAPFRVSYSGVLNATGATVSGAITATSGKFGQATSTNNQINVGTNTTNASIYTGGHTSLAATGNGFYLGSDGLSIGSGFSVTNAGVLTATGANLKNITIYDSSGNKRAAGTTDGFVVYDGASATTTTTLATFGATETTIGKSTDGQLSINSSGFVFKKDGNTYGTISVTNLNDPDSNLVRKLKIESEAIGNRKTTFTLDNYGGAGIWSMGSGDYDYTEGWTSLQIPSPDNMYNTQRLHYGQFDGDGNIVSDVQQIGGQIYIVSQGDSAIGGNHRGLIDLDSSEWITIWKNKRLIFSRTGLSTGADFTASIRASDYDNKTNIYYVAPNYHSFYCGSTAPTLTDSSITYNDGSGIAYIAPTYVQFNKPIMSGGNSNKLFITRSVSKDNIAVMTSSSYYISGNMSAIPSGLSGYTPVGIIGYNLDNASSSGQNVSYCMLYDLRISGTTVYYAIRDVHATSSSNRAKIKLTVYILYISDTQGL